MTIISEEDIIELLNRLSEWLYQTGDEKHSSHFSLVYVASGVQHVGTVSNQYIYITC